MITEKKGDLLSVTKGYIIHGCNAQGVMGGGVAKLIRDKYPKAYEDYRGIYEHFISKGKPDIPVGYNIYSTFPVDMDPELVIVNAVTQRYFGRDARTVYVDYKALRNCFMALNVYIKSGNGAAETTVNFPLIGCGLANGDWKVVSEIIDTELDDSIEKVLWIYE